MGLTNNDLLSDVVVYTKYAKYIPEFKRRENWEEIVDRYINMMKEKFKDNKEIVKLIEQNKEFIYRKEVLPSMRALQFAGAAMIKNESRGYNCSYLPMEHYKGFSELMFLLLGGTGVGYSVQYKHVEQLSEIQKPLKEVKYLIGDSIEGWADAVKQIMKSYFGIVKTKPRFDYSDIRSKGSRLVTAGGKAPGPEPLRLCLTKIESLLNEKEDGSKLTPFEVHRICCFIADAVLAGGIRRAALIALFSIDDKQMATCKHGHWWEKYPELGRSNNSAVVLRNRASKEDFEKLWKVTVDSKSGEPGIYFTNDPDYGTNPCCEISLRSFTFCNLCEINAGTVRSQKDFNTRANVAAFFGTLQASFTDFHYLRPIWKKNTEKDSLIGVGITGIASGNLTDINFDASVKIVKTVNSNIAKLININKAARTTTIKPSGTTSCILETSSGIHAWHDEYYIRNIQCAIGDDIHTYFNKNHPTLVKTMDNQPNDAVIGMPMKAPDNAVMRGKESAIDFLNRVKTFNLEWVKPGHNTGPNTNNVSATVSVKNYEWISVGEWMWENRHNYNGLSVMPYDDHSYKDAPFETCTEKEYNDRLEYINSHPIDLTLIIEEEDNTTQAAELACAGGVCEIT